MRYHESVWVGSLWGSGKLLLLIPVAALAACFSSNVQEGLACSEAGDCPIGQDCSAEGICSAGEGDRVDSGVLDDDATITDASPAPDAEPICPAGTVPCGEECLAECATEFATAGEATYQPEEGCTYLRMHAWGAGGGHGQGNTRATAGGYVLVERDVTSADSFTLVVGAPGASSPGGAGGAGGSPGGGNGGTGSSQGGGGGGGYSGVFLGAIDVANTVALAGGGGGSGGGSGATTRGGAGGGLNGQDGRTPGTGATQVAGNAPLQGGNGTSPNCCDGGGGGGGGFFGGIGGGGANSDASGGGGGSGYVGSAAVSDAQTGDQGTAGNAASPLRGTAGNVLTAGKVIISCIPKPTP